MALVFPSNLEVALGGRRGLEALGLAAFVCWGDVGTRRPLGRLH